MEVRAKAFGSYWIPEAPPETLGASGFGVRVPAGDLLGLRDEPPYLAWLEGRWGNIASHRRAKQWIKLGTIDELLQIASTAKDGHLPDLGAYRTRIKMSPGDTFTCPDFPTLAAWSLQRSAASGARLVECPSCHRPHFVSRQSSFYCRRPAQGLSTTCAQSYAHEAFAENRATWHKEYQRIYQRKLRGTVSETGWQRWRSDPNGSAGAPERFTPFDVWSTPEYQKQVTETAEYIEEMKAWGEQKKAREIALLASVTENLGELEPRAAKSPAKPQQRRRTDG